ncbi:uncharacterized protein LOC123626420 isoform X1 [Lemur catta]|uniref:uncharacterized protein LOC123626420 isoform X1 n=1 Tax=Lemur catta TaxID=9447 RepID=UPI001E267B5B|nr:uncharacterized protein LOC123626420 isoform X1 [Lemur catta]
MQFLVFQTLLYGKTLRKDVASQSAPPTTGRSQDPWRRNDFLSMFHEVTLSQATLASPPPHLQCPQGSQDQGPPWPVYPWCTRRHHCVNLYLSVVCMGDLSSLCQFSRKYTARWVSWGVFLRIMKMKTMSLRTSARICPTGLVGHVAASASIPDPGGQAQFYLQSPPTLLCGPEDQPLPLSSSEISAFHWAWSVAGWRKAELSCLCTLSETFAPPLEPLVLSAAPLHSQSPEFW